MSKRNDYITWDEYFMGVALLAAKRSKDPSTQVGACIVDDENRILSTGYNGFPHGCSDDEYPWEREGDEANTKYPYPVTYKLLSQSNRAMSVDIPYALENGIPVLPIMMENGIEELYSRTDRFGSRQYIDPDSTDEVMFANCAAHVYDCDGNEFIYDHVTGGLINVIDAEGNVIYEPEA